MKWETSWGSRDVTRLAHVMSPDWLMWCHPTGSCDVTRLAHVMSPDWLMWCHPTGSCDVTRLAHVISPDWLMWCHPTGSCDVTRLAHMMSLDWFICHSTGSYDALDWLIWCHPNGSCDVTRHWLTQISAAYLWWEQAFNILLERKTPGNHLDFFASKTASGDWVIHGHIQSLYCVTLCRRIYGRERSLLFNYFTSLISSQWRHNEHNGVSNHRSYYCLVNRLFRRRSKKASKLRVTGLCEGNSPVTGEFPAQTLVTRKLFPFDDVIMLFHFLNDI